MNMSTIVGYISENMTSIDTDNEDYVIFVVPFLAVIR